MQHPEPHDLTALAYDMIEGPEREALLEHLAACDACRAVYDSYRTEQAEVRETIMRDARSGAAEARALEGTLKRLEGAEAPRGRMLRLPLWVIAAEIAAVLVVAAGLFFVLKPGTETEVVPVADAARAPASVEGGVVYVSDRQGDWLPADGVPLDEIVKAGQGQEVRIALTDGSRARIQPGSLFRVSIDGANDGRPMVYLISGNSQIDASSDPGSMFVRAGETGFLAMPSARFAVDIAGGTDGKAEVFEGDVVMFMERGRGPVPLRHGENAEWSIEGLRLRPLEGTAAVITHEMDTEMVVRLRSIIDRVAEPSAPRFKELRRELEPQRRIVIQMSEARPLDEFSFAINSEHLTLSSNGSNLKLTLLSGNGRSQFERDSLDELLPHVPQNFLADIAKLEARHDARGLLRIARKD